MKKIILICLLTAPIFSFAQDKEAVRKILLDQVDSWNRGNLEKFMVGYWNNDSLLFIGSTGVNRGYNEALEHYKQTYSDTAKMGKLAFQILEIRPLSPDYYFVTGKWFLKRSVGDLQGVYTLLFKKINGKWLIVVDHSS